MMIFNKSNCTFNNVCCCAPTDEPLGRKNNKNPFLQLGVQLLLSGNNDEKAQLAFY
jgi:hypothetical protein